MDPIRLAVPDLAEVLESLPKTKDRKDIPVPDLGDRQIAGRAQNLSQGRRRRVQNVLATVGGVFQGPETGKDGRHGGPRP